MNDPSQPSAGRVHVMVRVIHFFLAIVELVMTTHIPLGPTTE